MILRRSTLDGIKAGTVTLAFRRWHRPSARAGGTLLTPAGKLSIASVKIVEPETITNDEARRAGYETREALIAELDRRSEDAIYRIEFGAFAADPRVALRDTDLDGNEANVVIARLAKIDARSASGPWTTAVLKLISGNPGRRAAWLCKQVEQEKELFKLNVRKLKELGLTESLDVGYRLSPRGAALLRHMSGVGLARRLPGSG